MGVNPGSRQSRHHEQRCGDLDGWIAGYWRKLSKALLRGLELAYIQSKFAYGPNIRTEFNIPPPRYRKRGNKLSVSAVRTDEVGTRGGTGPVRGTAESMKDVCV